MWMLKTDANGDSLWSRTYGDDEWDGVRAVQQTSDGGYILLGSTLIKTDADGDSLWSRTVALELPMAVQQTSDGGYILAGSWVVSIYPTMYVMGLLKTDANGDSLWQRSYGGLGHGNCDAFVITADSGYVLSGQHLLVKTDANGDSLWSRTFFGGTAQEVQQTSDGGYVLAGSDWSEPHFLDTASKLLSGGEGLIVLKFIFGGRHVA
jgi:hypothetical protein